MIKKFSNKSTECSLTKCMENDCCNTTINCKRFLLDSFHNIFKVTASSVYKEQNGKEKSYSLGYIVPILHIIASPRTLSNWILQPFTSLLLNE